MLGFLFIYFIGKYFYELANQFNKNKWLFVILGILSYYSGAFIGGIILGLISLIFAIEIDWDNQILMNAIAIPFGLGITYLLYFLLKRKWNSEIKLEDSIDDIGAN
jgi:hypothetical protein